MGLAQPRDIYLTAGPDVYSELVNSQVHNLHRMVSDCDVIVMGMMGAGKTTLIQHIQRYVPLRYLAQGDITRSILEFEPSVSLVEASAHAKPWSFELVLEVLQPLLALPDPYVLDGLPKHPHEAAWLRDQFTERGRSVVVLSVDADLPTVRSRINSPARVHRTDTAEEIEHRISTFNDNYEANLRTLAPVVSSVIRLDSVKYRPIELVRQVAQSFGSEECQ